jgi:hypothetical protein
MTPTPGSLACPPRFGTPRDPLRETLGGQTGEIARRLGQPLMPHQQLVADVALEVEDGRLVYDEVVLVIHRQAGKTTLVVAKTLNRLVPMARLYGPQRSTYVAQTRGAARRKLERDFSPMLRRSKAFTEITNPRQRPKRSTEWRMSLNNGQECIEVGPDCYWQIGVPDESSGHGDTLDDSTIDEARFLADDEVEEGLRPSQITRENAQMWVLSTPGKEKAYYLWRKVLAGRQACETGNHGRVAYFEWSAPDEVDDEAGWGDPDVWRACMPALGHTIGLDKVQSEWDRARRGGQEGIDTFRRAYLAQWPVIPVLPEDREAKGEGIEWSLWAALADPDAQRGPKPAFGVAVAPDRSWAAVAVAWLRPDGKHYVMVADYRPTTTWVAARVADLVERWGGAVVAPRDAIDLTPATKLTLEETHRAQSWRWTTPSPPAACATATSRS